MKRFLLISFFVLICTTIHAFTGTIIFESNGSYYLFNDGHETTISGSEIINKRGMLSSFFHQPNKSIDGIQYVIKDSDLSGFVKNHVNDLDASEKIFVVYNGSFTHLSLLIRKLNEAGYYKFDKTRFVQDLQLICIGNLDHEGSWKICDGTRTSYVDYEDGVYENTLKPYCSPSDSIVVKSSEEMQSLVVRSAIYYIDLITKKDRNEVVLLYQPFPISIIAREDALTLSVLTTVEAGTTIPSIKESILHSETNSLIVYCSQLKDSLSMIDITLDSWTLTDTLLDLSRISIDADGKVVFFDESKEKSVRLIDMLLENSIDNISEYDANNKQDTKENLLIVVLIGLVIVPAAAWLLLEKLKEEAKCALQGTSDKIIANNIRRKNKKI